LAAAQRERDVSNEVFARAERYFYLTLDKIGGTGKRGVLVRSVDFAFDDVGKAGKNGGGATSAVSRLFFPHIDLERGFFNGSSKKIEKNEKKLK
jgi:hypothetical protein